LAIGINETTTALYSSMNNIKKKYKIRRRRRRRRRRKRLRVKKSIEFNKTIEVRKITIISQ
jgi:hypothetical protein